jgi:endonuclease/exonuclease/phosphatase family metal-dependent hydrolase
MTSRFFLAVPAALALLASAAPLSSATAATLDVMSYNINWGRPGGARLEAIAKVIASSGAEVAGLQEIRRFWGKAGSNGNFRCQDQPAQLAAALRRITGQRWYSVYSPEKRRSTSACVRQTGQRGYDGVALVSRYRIRSTASYQLPYGRGLAKATIEVPGRGQVTVFATHLDHESGAKREVQARQVASLVRRAGGRAVFLTGDMNAGPGQAPIRALERVARDSWKDKGRGAGATRRGRIDYVFYRGGARVEAVRVIQNWTSDHRPVIARFRVG